MILPVATLNLNDFFYLANALKLLIRTFSEIYLEKVLYGQLLLIDFDVTMATNF